MGALNKEYLYKLLTEDSEDKNRQTSMASQNAFFNKRIMSPAMRGVSGLLGPNIGRPVGALLGTYGPLMAKTKIAGDTEFASQLAQKAPFDFLHDTGVIQALGITPFVMMQMAQAQSNINNTRNLDNKFISDKDFARYGNLASKVHGFANAQKVIPGMAAAGAGLAGLAGLNTPAMLMSHLNPFSMMSMAGSGITGGIGALTGATINPMFAMLPMMFAMQKIMGSFSGLSKTKSTPRFGGSMVIPGGQQLMAQSSFNRNMTTITMLQSQQLLSPKDALMLGILNEINLNTTPLKLDYMQKTIGEKEFHNNNARNRLADLYDPLDERFDSGLLDNSDPNSISAEELSKRKSAFHANVATNLMHSMGLAAIAGPLSSIFTGKSYNETRRDAFDILFGNNKLKAQAHEEVSKKINIPGTLLMALYTPVTKWLSFETPETQQLAILANMHELLRSSALSLVSLDKTMGGANGEKDGSGVNIHNLMEDTENKYLSRGKDFSDLKGIKGWLGPLWNTIIGKPTGGLLKASWATTKVASEGIFSPFLLLKDTIMDGISPLEDNKNRLENRFNRWEKGFDNLYSVPNNIVQGTKNKGKATWKWLKRDVNDVFGESLMGEALRKRNGFLKGHQIGKEYKKAVEEEKEYKNQNAAWVFLGSHFPDITMNMFHELKQQTIYFKDLLDCQNCRGRTLKKSGKKWRGSEGDFLTKDEYDNNIKSRALDKLKERLGYDELKNKKFGSFSKLFYKMFNIKEEEFHKMADIIDHLDKLPVSEEDFEQEDTIEGSGGRRGRKGFFKRNKVNNESDESIQKEEERKKEHEEFINREKNKAKNIKNISINTGYNQKIYKSLIKEFKENNKYKKSINKFIKDFGEIDFCCNNGSSLTPDLDLDENNRKNKKSKKNRRNRRNRRTRTSRTTRTTSSSRTREFPHSSGRSATRNIPNSVGDIASERTVPIEEKIKKAPPKARKGWKRFFRILKKIFKKKGLGKAFSFFIKRLTIGITVSLASAPETLGFGALIGILLTAGSLAWFVYDNWDIIKEAYLELKLIANVHKKAEMEHDLNSNHISESTFKKLIADKTFQDDSWAFKDNDVHFNKDKENELIQYSSKELLNLQEYASKHKKISKDDANKFYQFAQFKRYIEKDKNLDGRFKNMSNEEIQNAFKEYQTHFSQFQKDYKVMTEGHMQIQAASASILSNITNLLTKISLIETSSLQTLSGISSKIDTIGMKTVTINGSTI